jgi:hypothetical protein
MLMTTVVAVALGVAPVNQDPQAVTGDYSSQVGHYSQIVDRRGTTHVTGRDRLGTPYELVMDKNGNVEATFGERVITFRVQEQG